MQRKRSKKREAILNVLRSTKEHPNADWIYMQIKKEYPDISLATVYRNLAMFRKEGDIISVGNVNGHERYDADTSPHSHFICNKCGRILDLNNLSVDKDVLDKIESNMDIKVEDCAVVLSGLCKDCKIK